MTHIVLTEEQARVIAAAGGVVEVRDPQGQPFAYLTLLCPDGLESVTQNGGASPPETAPVPPSSAAAASQEGTELSLEFCWSKSRRKVRDAVKEFAEQTYADY